MEIGKNVEKAQMRAEAAAERLGHRLVRAFHLLALFVIGATIAWAAAAAYIKMVIAGHASLHDILLLFVYLEMGAMVGIYFKTEELPVEFLHGPLAIEVEQRQQLAVGGNVGHGTAIVRVANLASLVHNDLGGQSSELE